MKNLVKIEDKAAAWHSAQCFFQILGFVLGMAFLATLPWWLAGIALSGAWFTGYLLYRMDRGWRARQDLLYSGVSMAHGEESQEQP